MVITLPPQLEAVLSEQARQRGVAPELLALDPGVVVVDLASV